MAMNEGTVVSWMVAEGEEVEAGQELVEVEAAKTTQTVSTPVAGTVGQILVGEDETVAPKTVLCTLQPATPGAPDAPGDGEADGADEGPPSSPADEIPARAEVPGDAPAAVEPDAAEDVADAPARDREPARSSGRVQVAPRARRMAKDVGLDLAEVAGSGPGGRIVVADVEAALAGAREWPT